MVSVLVFITNFYLVIMVAGNLSFVRRPQIQKKAMFAIPFVGISFSN
jgi:hypothetical protein